MCAVSAALWFSAAPAAAQVLAASSVQNGTTHSFQDAAASRTSSSPKGISLKPTSSGVLRGPTDSDQVDWDTPGVWAQIAATVGIPIAAGTLFVNWYGRKRDLRLKRKQEQQLWAVLAVETSDAVTSELDAPVDTSSPPAVAALNRRDRLVGLIEQLRVAQGAFKKLDDPGNKGAWIPVVTEIGQVIQASQDLEGQYLWIHQLHERLKREPGNKDLDRMVQQLRTEVATKCESLLGDLERFRNTVGNWLNASGAVPRELREWLDTASRQTPSAA